MIDWDDAYSNANYIENGDRYAKQWAEQALTFRLLRQDTYQRLSYGSHPRETIDLFLPDRVTPAGLALFVHGGYWLAFDPSYWSHLAAGALANGWAVAVPSYTLTPEASITQITRQIGRAINHVAHLVAGPICLAGHSAGGHLVSRMVCTDTPLDVAVTARLRKVTSISGLHDLRPLLNTTMNKTLMLNKAEAAAESPVLNEPLPTLLGDKGIKFTCWVGDQERPEFVRQNDLLANIWLGLGLTIHSVHDPRMNHFTVVEALTDARSALVEAFIGDADTKLGATKSLT